MRLTIECGLYDFNKDPFFACGPLSVVKGTVNNGQQTTHNC